MSLETKVSLETTMVVKGIRGHGVPDNKQQELTKTSDDLGRPRNQNTCDFTDIT